MYYLQIRYANGEIDNITGTNTLSKKPSLSVNHLFRKDSVKSPPNARCGDRFNVHVFFFLPSY